jgi:YesN/AraC family two-component response regulator
MPMVDGLELARKARQRKPGVGIIVVSGRDRPRPGALPGVWRFFQKPYAAEEVVKAIDELV